MPRCMASQYRARHVVPRHGSCPDAAAAGAPHACVPIMGRFCRHVRLDVRQDEAQNMDVLRAIASICFGRLRSDSLAAFCNGETCTSSWLARGPRGTLCKTQFASITLLQLQSSARGGASCNGPGAPNKLHKGGHDDSCIMSLPLGSSCMRCACRASLCATGVCGTQQEYTS